MEYLTFICSKHMSKICGKDMMTNKTETLNKDLDKKNMERRTLALFAAVSDQ